MRFRILKSYRRYEAMCSCHWISHWILQHDISERNPHLHHYDVMVLVIHSFMSFAVPSVASLSHFSVVEETIASVARLDALVTFTVTYLQTNVSQKVGCHCQKQYNETFSMYLLVPFAQLTQKIGAYVEDSCLEDLKVFSWSVHELEDPASDLITLIATMEVLNPPSKRRIISVSLGLLSK